MEGLYAQMEDTWGSKTKRMCFTGWLLFSRQKKMLRKYLAMEVDSAAHEVSYYPRTLEEKEAFEDIRTP
jgi:hypothetical protein